MLALTAYCSPHRFCSLLQAWRRRRGPCSMAAHLAWAWACPRRRRRCSRGRRLPGCEAVPAATCTLCRRRRPDLWAAVVGSGAARPHPPATEGLGAQAAAGPLLPGCAARATSTAALRRRLAGTGAHRHTWAVAAAVSPLRHPWAALPLRRAWAGRQWATDPPLRRPRCSSNSSRAGPRRRRPHRSSRKRPRRRRHPPLLRSERCRAASS
jgi:hypothetical protein